MPEISVETSTGIVQANRGDGQPSRRSFLGVLLGVGAASMGALLSVPLVRFVLHPLLTATTPLAWTDVGSVGEFPVGESPVKKLITVEQRDGWRKIVSEKAVYVVKNANGDVTVLSSICPHLGCSVAWQAEKSQFSCPCHGGRFASDGKLLGGPPPRGLDTLESKVEEGVVKVHYQYFRQLVRDKEAIA